MNMINVTPLNPGYENRIARDLEDMFANGEIQSAMFSFTLVPEGKPLEDKASRLAKLFEKHRAAIKNPDLPVGILIQATLGHGWTPDSPAELGRFTLYNGTEPYIFCPLDPGFKKYIKQQLQTLSKLKADFFMLDDDFRMFTHREGCYCKRHLAEFNHRNNSNFTATELYQKLETDEALAREWDHFQQKGLVELAKIIRNAMAESKPDIQGMFCACAGDIRHAAEIAKILAAPGQKPVVRINNARYLVDSPRMWPQWTQKNAHQVAALPENFMILAETDTFPQNRYSTSAMVLHSQYAWSLLAGCQGGKLWITQMGMNEPVIGKAYRQILSKNRGFYQEIAAMKPEYLGVVDPIPAQSLFQVKHPNGIEYRSWATSFMGIMGLPFSYEKGYHGSRPVALGEGMEFFSDEEIKQFLSGTVLLNGDAAIALTKRGFAKYLGVQATEWKGPKATFEVTHQGKKIFRMPSHAYLKAVSPRAKVLSTLYHANFAYAANAQEVAPGMVKFQNESGGTVLVMAAQFSRFGHGAFGILNETRKAWLTENIDFGIYYPEDAPLHLTVFRDRGKLTVAMVNLGLDLIDKIPLNGLKKEIQNAQLLQCDGKWKKVPFENHILNVSLLPMQIAFFRFN